MSIDISRPWARTSPATALQAGGFFTVTNKAGEADRLIAAASPVAAKIEIHGIKVVGRGITMRPMEKGPRPAARYRDHAEAARLSSALHELKAPLAKGEQVPVTPDVREGRQRGRSSWWSRRRARSATRP